MFRSAYAYKIGLCKIQCSVSEQYVVWMFGSFKTFSPVFESMFSVRRYTLVWSRNSFGPLPVRASVSPWRVGPAARSEWEDKRFRVTAMDRFYRVIIKGASTGLDHTTTCEWLKWMMVAKVSENGNS